MGICGYVYDPAEHEGVSFEDLPDDWKCPRCRQSKENSTTRNFQRLIIPADSCLSW
ncbi:MAG: rubredoxin [Clostridiales bacterium]|nr:rubredoxin [Clostridiales bacterium]